MRNIVGIGLVLCLSSAQAQNLVQNPQFDSDAAGWNLSTYATWSNHVDRGGVTDHGSLQISTSSVDDAVQCVELDTNTQYAFSVWSEKDPQGSIAPCANGRRRVSVLQYEGTQCTGQTTAGAGFIFPLPEPEGWVSLSRAFATDGATHSALFTLEATCSSPGGLSTYYFDDVTIQPDDVFANDFEEPSPGGGPSQSPGG